MAEKKTTNHWIILVLLALAQFMVVLDVSIVNVMLPTVQRAFSLSDTNLQWIITAYSLAFGGFLLLGGRAADLFGRRRVFLSGVAMFSLVSLLDGLSQSGGMLISLRALQGLSGAFMSPAALSIVLVTYREGHERNVALSVWGAVASGGAAVGVLLGGILTQYLGWRWNFFINVPVGIFVLITAMRILPKHESEEKHTDLDLPGAVSVTAALMLIVYALTQAPTDGWLSHKVLLYFGVSLLLLIGFVYNELHVKHPLIPLTIFRLRNITGANLIQLSIAASLFSVFFFTTLYVQDILGYSPVRTGFSFLPVPFAIALTATNVPKLIRRIGFKPILMTAPLVSGVGLLLLAHVPVHGGYLEHILPGLVIMGLGLGATFVSVLVAATAGVPGHLSGLASGLVNTAQQIGGALGLAVLTGISASSMLRYMQHKYPVTHQVAVAATVHGFQSGYYVAAGFTLAAAVFATLILKKQGHPTEVNPAVMG
jgi:EmrB/QacA subfamily drug resistance transporter